MRNKNRTGAFIILGLALFSLLVYVIYTSSKTSRHDWRETYKQNSKEPYGTNLLSNLLKSYFGKNNFTVGTLPLSKALAKIDSSKIKTYLFIGDRMFLRQEDADTLLAFVAKGNQALISAQYIPSELNDSLGFHSCGTNESMTGREDDSICRMNFYHPRLGSPKPYQYKFVYKGESVAYEWNYFLLNNSCDSLPPLDRLGYSLPNHLNFIRVPYGSGFFYFHLNPMVFTNYSLLDESHVEYCEKVFAHLPEGKCYWDELSRMPSPSRRHPEEPGKGPLHYLLSQTPIRWAWYTMLGLIITYFLFRAVRRQRVIPVILPNANTSLEFVQTVGELYYQQSDHQKLIIQKMKLFLLFIRNRYYLTTNILDPVLVRAISVKSQIPAEDVDKIFKLYNVYQNTVVAVDQNELIAFHKALEHFYKNCK